MAIFGTGINWGILIGFLVGGWINEWYGWRVAFLVVGLPGVLLALIVQLTVKEPPRGYSEAIKSEVKPPSFWTVASLYGATQCFGTLSSPAPSCPCRLCIGHLVPSYLVRIHEMGTGGGFSSYLALLIGVGGALGIYIGGRIADFMAASRGQQWLPWVVAVSSMISLPLLYLTFMAQTPMAAIAAYVLPAMLGTLYVAPGFALIQNSTPLEMRSVAAAIISLSPISSAWDWGLFPWGF